MTENRFLFISEEQEFAQIKRSLEGRYEALKIDLIDCPVKGFNMYLGNDYSLVTITPDITQLKMLQFISSLSRCKASFVVVVAEEKRYDNWIKALSFGANYVLPRELPMDGKLSFFTAQHLSSYKSPRLPKQPSALMFNENLTIDPTSRQVLVNSIPIDLTARQYDLLLYFSSNPDRIITHKDLGLAVWQSEDTTPNTIAAFVSQLRQLIEPDPQKPAYIETINKVGYRFNNGNSL